MPSDPPTRPQPGRGPLLVACLAMAIVLDTAGQLLWKLAATRLPSDAAPAALLEAVLHDPVPLLVIGVFLVQFVNWMVVLERADLSFAQPLTATSYISVCLLSAWLFGEALTPSRLIGVLLVLVGVVLVSVTPSKRPAA